MRVVLIGHRWVNHPRGAGYAWGLAQTGAELEVLRVGFGATEEPIAELPRVPVRAIPIDPDRKVITATPKPNRPGWFYVREFDPAKNTHTTYISDKPPSGSSGVAEEIVRSIGNDHGILLKGMQLSPHDVEWIAGRADLTYVLVDVATPYTVERGRHCARAIVTGPEAAPAFERYGRPTRVIIQGYRPHVWAPCYSGEPARHVLFTGTERHDRIQALTALRQAGVPTDRREAWLEDAAELYGQAAVTLCPHNSPDGRNSFSNRLVRVMASGGVPLHAWSPFLAETFPDVPSYRTFGELVAQARLLLDGDTAELREQMRAAAEPYTWDKVAARWLDFIAAAPRSKG